MPRTVLIVDDDPHIRQVLVFAFARAGIDTIEAGDGEQALLRYAEQSLDLVVLDITMPKMDGLDVCRRMRADGGIPILFLSSRDEEIDRVLGIELGADDYVVKPFSPREVVARANAIMRRSMGRAASAPDIAGHIQHGKLMLDSDAWSARWDDRDCSLTVSEFSLLRALAAAPTRFLTRDELIDKLHGPGFALTDRTIDSHVRNLRRKFAELGCEDLIETKASVGYRIGACGRVQKDGH